MSKLRCSALVLLLAVSFGAAVAVLETTGDRRQPLSIPSATALGPPAGIEFFGAALDHDVFVWCLDRSCSMGWAGEILVLKNEVSSALLQLSPTHEFSLVRFNQTYSLFSGTLLPAEPSNVAQAVAWVQTLTPSGSTCLIPAVGAALDFFGSGPDGGVILVADGIPQCTGAGTTPAEVVAEITPLNPLAVPIHAFYVPGDPTAAAILMAIADAFGGVYVDISSPLDQFSRGDVNLDGSVDVADAVYLLAAGYLPGSPQPACLDAADVDDNGEYEVLVDATALLQWVFVPGSAPLPPPTGSCGQDPTFDGLACFGSCL